MASEEIEITIAKDGGVQILVRGIKGKACLDLTHDLETALGGVILSREMTSEADQKPDTETVLADQPRRMRAKRSSSPK
jgi:hypothetical protein